eukprot:TRINITY_DN16337_c0_g1_i1.p2 TRINITY_DN16337_c0_g1~~TRINITY_DN16337_c0_g1_i1.p2  ORF type:complete len:112 (-),score=23.44 TRINITY_DN16337_c0_g1_i1:7-318(-)
MYYYNDNFHFHIDCFKIGTKPYVLGGLSYTTDARNSFETLINLLRDNEDYFPNVHSKVLEDFSLRYPGIVNELLEKGVINKKITFIQAHQYDPPITLPEEEEI